MILSRSLAILASLLSPAAVWAQSKIDFTNPNLKLTDLVDEGGNGIANLMQGLVQALVPIAGVVAIVLIIAAGIIRIVAGGNDERVKTSGDMLWAAISGLGLALVSVILLKTINPDLIKLTSLNFDKIKKITPGGAPKVGLTPSDEARMASRTGGRARAGAGGSGGGGDRSGDGTGPAMDDLTLTNYYPVDGSGEKSMEGGLDTSRPGLNGRSKVCTLEMYYQWKTNGVGDCSYVTLASDPSNYGQRITISERSWRLADGTVRTERNIPGFVHDTGSAFRGRPDKYDIATDISHGDRDAVIRDSQQPNNNTLFFLNR